MNNNETHIFGVTNIWFAFFVLINCNNVAVITRAIHVALRPSILLLMCVPSTETEKRIP